MLEQYLKERRQQREILLMTHIVLGHPHFETSLRLVESMVHAGVDLIELQIPFSEPMADGPVILRANQEALSAGSTVERCFEVATEVARRFPHGSFALTPLGSTEFQRVGGDELLFADSQSRDSPIYVSAPPRPGRPSCGFAASSWPKASRRRCASQRQRHSRRS